MRLSTQSWGGWLGAVASVPFPFPVEASPPPVGSGCALWRPLRGDYGAKVRGALGGGSVQRFCLFLGKLQVAAPPSSLVLGRFFLSALVVWG